MLLAFQKTRLDSMDVEKYEGKQLNDREEWQKYDINVDSTELRRQLNESYFSSNLMNYMS